MPSIGSIHSKNVDINISLITGLGIFIISFLVNALMVKRHLPGAQGEEVLY